MNTITKSNALHKPDMNPKNYPILSQLSRKRKLQLLMQKLHPQDHILEVGSGSGWFTIQLRDRGHTVTTLDLKPPADYIGDIRNWQSLGIPPHHFDVIVALELIEHVDCLECLQSLCKPNGLILLSSPHPHWDWIMQGLEILHLTQKRTSPHTHLINFQTIPLEPIIQKRPLGIHQVGLFRNRSLADPTEYSKL